jgi:hypothetical protein
VDTPPERVGVLTATRLEARAASKRIGRACEVVECGVGLARVRAFPFDVAISCGLAGGLRAGVPTGTVLIPCVVQTARETRECDAEWTRRLRESSRALGYEPLDDPMLSSTVIVSGPERERWARDGFAGADMETAFIPVQRIAAVRVVLDTPEHELSPEWIAPLRAILRPKNWPQAAWLAQHAGRCADIAARVLARALE